MPEKNNDVDLSGFEASVDRACAVIDRLRGERDALVQQRDELLAALKAIEANYICVCKHGKLCCNNIPNVYCPRCIAHKAIASVEGATHGAPV